jgi:probable addiction module antidote protein
MALETFPFDIADKLHDDEFVAVYLDEALASGDAAYFAYALGKVAKARGLYAALSEGGNPTLATLMEVMKSLGLRLGAEAVKKAA